MILKDLLVSWYHKNKRSLPWRETKDPYKIWVSEIILQQTRVDQGLNYYLRFIEAFPNVKALAEAEIDEVLRLWQGLGYYSRARNMHYSANYIVMELKGIFPNNYSDLLKLKGVGDYTASAIASISFNEKVAVLDGNAFRVYSRLFNIGEPINTSKGLQVFKDVSNELIDEKHPGDFNQAVMEFGARYCVPQKPDCLNCTLNTYCLAFEKNIVDALPVKVKKIKVKDRYFNYIMLIKGENTYIYKRNKKDIWEGLYEVVLNEIKTKDFEADLNAFIKKNVKSEHQIVYTSSEKKHLLSHQKLLARFTVIKINEEFTSDEGFIKVKLSELDNYPFPKLLIKFLDEFKKNYLETY